MTDSPPVVQTINELPETAPDRDLFVRLHLDYVKYAEMEDLIDLGIAKLEERAASFREMKADDLPYPFSQRDLDHAMFQARDDVTKAKQLRENIRRVKPR